MTRDNPFKIPPRNSFGVAFHGSKSTEKIRDDREKYNKLIRLISSKRPNKLGMKPRRWIQSNAHKHIGGL